MREKTVPRATIFGFALLTLYLCLFLGLGDVAFLGADEPRYARIAEEMLERGDWVTPHLESRPWLEKPPLLYWMAASSYSLFGVSEWAARFPVALAGAVTAALAGWAGYAAAGTRAGLFSFLILCTSGLFVGLSRSASTDAPLTAALTAALLFGYFAASRSGLHWAALAGAFLALAALAKGPVAPLLFGAIFTIYFVLRQRFLWSLGQTVLMGGVFSALAIPWYWLVWRANGFDFVITFWINHHLARFVTDKHHHSEPIYYYAVVLFFGFFPWSFFLVPAVASAWRRRAELLVRGRDAEFFLWIWAATPFVFFSAASSKLGGYILPCLPPLAVITALLWDRYVGIEVGVYRSVKRSLNAAGLFALVLALALPAAAAQFYDSSQLGLLLALPLVVGLAVLGRRVRKGQPAAAFLTLAAMMALFIGHAYWRAAPVIEGFHSARAVVSPLRPELTPDDPLVFYRYFHHSARYYADYNASSHSIGSLSDLLDHFESSPRPSYRVLTKREGWQDLDAYFRSRLIERRGNLYLAEVRPHRER